MTDMKDNDGNDGNDLVGIDDRNNDLLTHLDDEALYQKHHWPRELVTLAEVIRSQLQRDGVNDEAVYRLTERVLLSMSFLCGGRNYYLPQGGRIRTALRNKKIYDQFNGRNIRELGRAHRLTDQQIYAIIREQRQLHRTRVQPGLFPSEPG